MTRFTTGLHAFFDELRRRHVFRVAAAYAVGVFVVLQGADLLIQGLPGTPEWVYPTLTVVSLVGFPIALVLGWAYQWTAHGIRREEPIPGSAEDGGLQPAVARTRNPGSARAFAYVGLGIVIAIVGTGLSLPLMYSREDAGSIQGQREGVQLASNEGAARTLAVLPFMSLTGNDDSGFADGLAEDITAALAQIGGLEVVSRTTSEAYRDTDKTVRAIGAELGVGLILEGTIRRAGDRVRVTVQLIDAQSDRHLWASSYDRDLTGDIFDTQSDLAQEIVAAIQSVVVPEQADHAERQLLAGRFSDAGNELLERADPNVDVAAEQQFAQALELDADNPVAHAGIAQTLLTRTAQGGPPALLDSAAAHAQYAIRLDPQLAEAHAAHAFVLIAKGELDSARVALRQAHELDDTGAKFEFVWQERLRMISPEALEQAMDAIGELEVDLEDEDLRVYRTVPTAPAAGGFRRAPEVREP